jgi:peptidoglycan/xylan/chitin deacetylase (PgdA/CDA1 family)
MRLIGRTAALVASAVLIAPLVPASAVAAPPAPDRPLTVVTLQFDDGRGERDAEVGGKRYNLRKMLNRHGVRATFFVNAGHTATGADDYWRRNGDHFSWAELRQLQADGHEIGGHTVDHPFLTGLDPLEQKRQICRDRSTLLAHGLRVTNFAYPYGAVDDGAKEAVRYCGYNSGRGVTGLWGTGCESGPFADPNCPYAEKLTNQPDVWNLRTEEAPTANFYLWNLQRDVVAAEQHGGGWVQIFFHRFCDWCDTYSTNPLVLDAFLRWLTKRATTHNTVIRTSQEVLGGALKPAVAPPAAAPNGANLFRNGDLEAGSNDAADCVEATGFARTPGAHGKGLSVNAPLETDVFTRVRIPLDQGACAPEVTAGRQLEFTLAYRSTGSPRLQAWYRQPAGGWVPWVVGPHLAPAAQWTPAGWRLPAVPAGATAVSVGVALAGEGGLLAVDDLVLRG